MISSISWGSNESQGCNSTGSLKDFAHQIHKQVTVQNASENMRDFCQRNMLLRFLNNQDSSKDFSSWSTEKLETEASRSLSLEVDAWQMTLVPTLKTRQASVLKNKSRTNYNLEEQKRRFSDKSFEKYLSKTIPRPSDLVADEGACWKKISGFTGDSNVGKALKNIPITAAIGKWGTCLKIEVKSAPECKRGADILTNRLAPWRGKTSVTRPDLFHKIVSNTDYDDGLRRAAQKIFHRVNRKINNQNGIFEDLKSSFEESGMNSKQAEDAAWDSLALISTSGPNILSRLNECRNVIESPDADLQLNVSLAYISAAMPLLDFQRNKKGEKLYSFPKDIEVTCDTGKPYHFWMAAYSTRELIRKDGLEPSAATNATYLASIGYQVLRNMNSGESRNLAENRFNGVLKHDSFSPVMNVVRADLAYAAAGAQYGSGIQKESSKLSIDKKIVKMLSAAESNNLSYDPIENKIQIAKDILNWNDIISPISALKEK